MADDDTAANDASIETATRSAEAAPRATTERRWEVFVREEADDPMTHVGTIAAPSPEVAHEEASTLFAWYARDLWVCPTDETYRYSSETLGSEYAERDASEKEPSGARSEPRVYEETEGTPNVRSGGSSNVGTGGEKDGTNSASRVANGGDRE